ncbi:MAG TPA: type II toxin-antitoxin system death-on-curing family toxin [Isosphaeraceae bacterium]
MKTIGLGQVLWIHRRVIETSGGDPTVLDLGKIESALAQPRMTFGGADLYPTLAEKAAALGFSLIKNHPFLDGNKRTGIMAVLAFLGRNGYRLIAPVDEAEAVILGVADGTVGRGEFARWIRGRMVRKR